MKSEENSKNEIDEETITSKNNYDVDIQACSATDLTGLIPTAPESEAEIESYEDIYPFIPRAKGKKKN